MNSCFFSSFILIHSELFGKVVVASKVPLPNYRPDLDDKRPQREVRAWVALVGCEISTNSLILRLLSS
jgi:hypothetical protein